MSDEPIEWETSTAQFKSIPIHTKNGDFHLLPGSTYTAEFIAEHMSVEDAPVSVEEVEEALENTTYIRPTKKAPRNVVDEKSRPKTPPRKKSARKGTAKKGGSK